MIDRTRRVWWLTAVSFQLVFAIPLVAQQRPTPAQAQALLQTRPDLIAQLEAQLKASGLSNDQIRARLRAEGYPDNLLDSYLPGATGSRDSTAMPGDDVFSAMRALGLADTTMLDSLRGMANGQRRLKVKSDSAFMDTLTRAVKNDSVRAAIRRMLRSNEAMRATSDSGFTIFGLNLFHGETSQFDATSK